MTRKYGRTYHLPTSQGLASDDKVITDLSVLETAHEIVVTEKMDGENTTIHAQGCHPRSPDARDHPSRDWVKAFAASVSPMLTSDERIIGENLYAKHAIAYNALPSFFLGFAWIKEGLFQPWDATLERFASLGVTPVPVLFRGAFSHTALKQLAADLDTERQEGFVVRLIDGFPEQDMDRSLAKYVRKNHVQTDVHWTKAPLIPNRMVKRS
ncbi:RNA ligase family protein [uncultured Tateyamaria sp.]|uniref:RNA ligase family protein n=1 Tax=uncultured Tateyamaria sp. TaxID=455651 RepID=UPI00263717C5|nr:RNA ligase family protein [uncultured Tateyamaria sp.]